MGGRNEKQSDMVGDKFAGGNLIAAGILRADRNTNANIYANRDTNTDSEANRNTYAYRRKATIWRDTQSATYRKRSILGPLWAHDVACLGHVRRSTHRQLVFT